MGTSRKNTSDMQNPLAVLHTALPWGNNVGDIFLLCSTGWDGEGGGACRLLLVTVTIYLVSGSENLWLDAPVSGGPVAAERRDGVDVTQLIAGGEDGSRLLFVAEPLGGGGQARFPRRGGTDRENVLWNDICGTITRDRGGAVMGQETQGGGHVAGKALNAARIDEKSHLPLSRGELRRSTRRSSAKSWSSPPKEKKTKPEGRKRLIWQPADSLYLGDPGRVHRAQPVPVCGPALIPNREDDQVLRVL